MSIVNTTEEGRGGVVVTGASRGLGRHMAFYLAARGFHVFAGVRKEADGAALADETDGRLTPLRLDVTDEESIAAAVAQVAGAVGEAGLAGLVNNAGIALFGPVEQVSLAAAEEQLRVNVLGPVAVTQAFLPLLRKAPGRLVNVSSVNGWVSTPYSGLYCASKFALEALSDALRLELRPWGIAVSVVQPGAFDTALRARTLAQWAAHRAALPEEAQALYRPAFEGLKGFIETLDARAPDPTPVSEAVYAALTAATPQTRYPVGEDAQQLQAMKGLPDEARDAALLKAMGA